MFYNLYRSTKAAEKEYQQSKLSNIGRNIITPSHRLNIQKRKKLKDLLTLKFIKKYNLKNRNEIIDNEITKFVEGEKLSDKDLQNLDNIIEQLISSKKVTRNLKSTLDKSLSDVNIPLNQPQGGLPLISPNPNSQNSNQNDDLQSIKKLRPSASVEILPSHKRIYKNQDEELASLEAELAELEPKKEPIKRLDFSGLGDEWYAMATYNKLLYEKQIQEERKKDLELKRRTREDLDSQVRNKLRAQLEEKLKEKEEYKIFQDHLKQMDIIEKEKRESIKKQILKEKISRESQIKNEFTRRKIDQLKQKKFELNLIKNIQEEMEKEKKAAIEKRIKENEALRKVLKENEINKEKQRELMKKEKELDVEIYKEMEKNEIKKDLERKRYFNDIKRSAHQYDEKNTSAIINKIKQEQIDEDNKVHQLMLDNQIKEKENELKLKIKKKEDKIRLKNFLDKQIEEKKKELNFLKKIDDEQGRIWSIDNKRYNDDQIRINNIIKSLNLKNLDIIKQQIKNKETQKHREIMSLDEYAMNKQFLEKAKEELEQRKK